jgi:hypothetical protein
MPLVKTLIQLQDNQVRRKINRVSKPHETSYKTVAIFSAFLCSLSKSMLSDLTPLQAWTHLRPAAQDHLTEVILDAERVSDLGCRGRRNRGGSCGWCGSAGGSMLLHGCVSHAASTPLIPTRTCKTTHLISTAKYKEECRSIVPAMAGGTQETHDK